MGRIRSIKPEFPQSESMGNVSREARLCFILLWTIVDDSGRTRASSRMLASLLFPYDNDAPGLIDGWLGELERERCIARYVADGFHYLEVCKWANHQRIDRPTPSKIPPFDESSRVLAEPSRTVLAGLDLEGIGSGKERNGRADAPPESSKRPHPYKPEDVSEQTWLDWLTHRKSKRATVSATVINRLRKDGAAAGMTLEEAMSWSVSQGYAGFFPPTKVGTNGKPSKPATHIQNMPMGSPSCACAECDKARAKMRAEQ